MTFPTMTTIMMTMIFDDNELVYSAKPKQNNDIASPPFCYSSKSHY